jgi:hypothetical protein
MSAIKKPEIDNAKSMRKLAVVLAVMGLLLVIAHSVFLREQQNESVENWSIVFDTTHYVARADTVVSIQPPYESENIRLIGRRVNHIGLKIATPPKNELVRRAIRFRAKQPGTYQTEIEFTLQYSRDPAFHKASIEKLGEQRRELFLADIRTVQYGDQFEAKTSKLSASVNGMQEAIDEISQYVQGLKRSHTDSLRSLSEIIRSGTANNKERVLLMVALSRRVGVPARVITGVELKEDPSAELDYWVEVFNNEHWESYPPDFAHQGDQSGQIVVLDKSGNGVIATSKAGAPLEAGDYTYENNIAIERLPVTTGSPDITQNRWYQIFIFDRLPVGARDELSLLMLLPLGALLCSLIRQFVGVHSYGVFTPTILALAMTYAEVETTTLIIIVTMVLVYFGRPAFHHELSRTPRLSIIFTLVAIGMVFGVSMLDYFSLATEGHLVLLPIVIITSLIDRFFSTFEKLGNRTAFVRLAWTAILTISVMPLLSLSWLGAWILRYPEIHLFTLSLLIFVAYYPFGKHKIPQWLGFLSEKRKKSI